MNPHWFDFLGPPTPFPMINPPLVPIQKIIKNQIKAATVIEELGLQRLAYSRRGGTERERQKETGREKRG